MIDTLRVSLSPFKVERDNGLTVEKREVRGESVSHGLLWNSGGRPVEGVKAYYNGDRFNLTVKPPRPSYGRGCQVPGCWVSLSVPKYHAGLNVNPVDRREAEAVLGDLETDLAAVGVKTDITRAIVNRVDLFRNVEASEPFNSYHPVLSVLPVKRTQSRDYGTTFLWHNSRREYCVYDKREELRLAGQPVDGLPDNLIRFEHRLLSRPAVVGDLQLATVGDLLTQYDRLPDYYVKAMRSNLFPFKHYGQAVRAVAIGELEAGLEAFRASDSRFWVEDCLAAFGAETILESVGREGLREVLNRVRPGDRAGNWRAVKRVDVLRFRLTCSRRSRSGKTLGGLYSELRSKVLAA